MLLVQAMTDLTTEIHPILLANMACEANPSLWSYLLQGTLIGLAIAIPVGPIAFICMQYALNRGFRLALSAGIGAALADTFFGLLAGLGLTMITDWVLLNKCWIQFLGGIFLCLIGAELCFKKNHKAICIDTAGSYFTALTTTFFLTLANPLTILAFMALFGYFGLAEICNTTSYAAMTIIGVFIGSLCWWICLAYFTSKLRGHFSGRGLILFREVGGTILLICGAYAIISCYV